MKFPSTISILAAILFFALGVACVLLDLALRDQRIEVGAREDEVRSAETRLLALRQTRQTLEQKIESQEEADEALRLKVVERQMALQTQQEQINQGTQISQQIGPNLLHDMALAAQRNEKIKTLLTRLGYTIQIK